MPATLILADHVGRIGNRLTLYTHVIAAAEELGCRVLNLSLLPHAHLFSGTHLNPFASYPASKFPLNLPPLTRCLRRPLEELVMAWRRRGRPEMLAGFRILDQEHRPKYNLASKEFAREVARHRLILMWGYSYRCPEWVKKNSQKISHHLSVRAEVAPWASQQIEEARHQGKTTCAIHLRQGDFKTWRGGKYHLNPASVSETLRKTSWPHPCPPRQFFICSDEMVPPGIFPTDWLTGVPRAVAEDLYLLSRADWVVGGVSTFFSWSTWEQSVMWGSEEAGLRIFSRLALP